MSERRNWTREEVWAALFLYLKTEFGRIHKGNPEIIALGQRLGRSPSAVALKMSNLAALDETLDRKGMGHTGQIDKIVWQEWMRDKAKILDIKAMPPSLPNQNAVPGYRGFAEGRDRFVQGKQRVGQDYFREMILSGYRSKCALTGIDDARLLNASHIVGWAEDTKSRLDPSNGICLNALHDRAFDRHLISFDEDYRMLVSKSMPDWARAKLKDVACVELRMPDKFLPGQDYLERHRKQFFDAQSS